MPCRSDRWWPRCGAGSRRTGPRVRLHARRWPGTARRTIWWRCPDEPQRRRRRHHPQGPHVLEELLLVPAIVQSGPIYPGDNFERTVIENQYDPVPSRGEHAKTAVAHATRHSRSWINISLLSSRSDTAVCAMPGCRSVVTYRRELGTFVSSASARSSGPGIRESVRHTGPAGRLRGPTRTGGPKSRARRVVGASCGKSAQKDPAFDRAAPRATSRCLDHMDVQATVDPCRRAVADALLARDNVEVRRPVMVPSPVNGCARQCPAPLLCRRHAQQASSRCSAGETGTTVESVHNCAARGSGNTTRVKRPWPQYGTLATIVCR